MAEFSVKGIVASGMVLQRNIINCIHGTAEPETEVTMNFRYATNAVVADAQGNWKIEFNPGEAGGPFKMNLSNGTNQLEFSDVYVGEVWVNSGQSNAQLPMARQRFTYPEEFELPANPWIRMITIPITWTYKGEKDSVENPVWWEASPETIGLMSGTAYFFAKKLSAELKMPVGIINTSQGGSPIQAWLNKDSLKELGKDEYLKEVEYFENDDNVAAKQKELAENNNSWYGELEAASSIPDLKSNEGWSEVEVPGYIDFGSAGTCWIKKTVALTEEQVAACNAKKTWVWFGTITDADRVYVNGTKIGETTYSYPPRRYEVPAGTLIAGENIISVRLQLNSHYGKIRLFEEKPYYLFTEDVYIEPSVSRNVERKGTPSSENSPVTGCKKADTGVCIPLNGKWLMKVDAKVRDCPPGMFFEWVPTALYNAMLAPCFTHGIAGALWYQGESNADKAEEYKDMLLKLFSLWRQKFTYAVKDMPFVVMQLPNWSDGHGEDICCLNSSWANLRKAQADAVENDEKAGLSVTIDAGEWNDLHPEKKRTGGTRAAMEALRVAYRYSDISPAPSADFVEFGRKIYNVHFDCGRSSLVACNVEGKAADLNSTRYGGRVYGFSILYEKKGELKLAEADATLTGDDTVEVRLPKLGFGAKIKELRYLWADSPAPVNLYSKELLPAAPFKVGVGK